MRPVRSLSPFILLFLLLLLAGSLIVERRLRNQPSRNETVQKEMQGLQAVCGPQLYYYLSRPRRIDIPVIGRMALAPRTVLLQTDRPWEHDTLLLLQDPGEPLPPGTGRLLWQGYDTSCVMRLITQQIARPL